MKDALDNNIIIGNIYGASYTCDGKDTVVIGRAVKVNEAKTTLDVISGKYMGRFDRDWQSIEVGTKKPIYHIKLFPVRIAGEEWGKQFNE